MYAHRKLLTAGLAALFLGCIFGMNGWEIFVVEKVAAQAAPPHPDQFYNTMIQFIGFVQSLLLWLLYIVLYLLERLFDPNAFITDYLTPEGGGVGPLQTLWMHSRDIVNVILAFILVGGAVMTIVFAKGDYFKTKIVQFLVAIILVNFSWFFPRVVIDTANVLTATVYALPAAIGYNCVGPDGGDCYIWEDPQFDLNESARSAWIRLDNDNFCTPDFAICYKRVTLDRNANSPAALLLGLVINNARLFNLSTIPDIPDDRIAGVPIGTDRASRQIRLVIYALFSFILIAALFFPLAAMLIVFIVRIPWLWLTIAFMPFMFLGLILGDKMGEFDTMKIWKKFLGAAFVPLFVAIPIAIGFMLLNTGIDIIAMPDAGSTPGLFSIDNFLDLLWLGMTLGVLYIGTFAALKAAHIAETIVTSIESYGQALGKGLAMLPARIPFIPVPGGKGLISAGAAAQGLKKLANPYQQWNDQLDKAFPDSGLGGSGEGVQLADKIKNSSEPKYKNINTKIENDIRPNFNVVNQFKNAAEVEAHEKIDLAEVNRARDLIKEIEKEMKKANPSVNLNEKTITEFANRYGASFNEEAVKKLRE
ncbi:MAG: hypothetical protein ABIA92_01110 [Patescibacteria group bacterium]